MSKTSSPKVACLLSDQGFLTQSLFHLKRLLLSTRCTHTIRLNMDKLNCWKLWDLLTVQICKGSCGILNKIETTIYLITGIRLHRPILRMYKNSTQLLLIMKLNLNYVLKGEIRAFFFCICNPSYLIKLTYSDICYLHDFIMKQSVIDFAGNFFFLNNIKCVWFF